MKSVFPWLARTAVYAVSLAMVVVATAFMIVAPISFVALKLGIQLMPAWIALQGSSIVFWTIQGSSVIFASIALITALVTVKLGAPTYFRIFLWAWLSLIVAGILFWSTMFVIRLNAGSELTVAVVIAAFEIGRGLLIWGATLPRRKRWPWIAVGLIFCAPVLSDSSFELNSWFVIQLPLIVAMAILMRWRENAVAAAPRSTVAMSVGKRTS